MIPMIENNKEVEALYGKKTNEDTMHTFFFWFGDQLADQTEGCSFNTIYNVFLFVTGVLKLWTISEVDDLLAAEARELDFAAQPITALCRRFNTEAGETYWGNNIRL